MTFKQLKLEDVQRRLMAQNGGWHASENNMTRLSLEDVAKHLGGAIAPDGVPIDEMEAVAHARNASARMLLCTNAGPEHPPVFDWRSVNGQNFVTSMKYQGTCGACTAFGSAAAIETMICIATATSPRMVNGVEYPDLSEAQIFYCGGGAAQRTCQLGWFLPAALAYCKDTGVAQESFFPYVSCDQPCGLKPGWESNVTKISGETKLSDPVDMRTWIATKGPAVAMMIVYSDFVYYHSGIYQHSTGDRLGVHCVAVVGYDEDQQAWLCKNSWSSQWGDGGFFQIAFGECGIESAVHGIDGLAVIGPPA